MPRFSLRTALVVAATAALPLLLHSGFLNTRGGGDSPFLLFRLHQLIAALQDGHFPARWMPDAAYGLGYPFFHYYAALSFYIAAAFKAFGFSYVLSLKLTHLLGFLVAAGGMYGWIQGATRSRAAAWLAAAAYTFVPFHMVNVYVRGDSLAEFWAMALYPLCLWAAHRLTERPSPGSVSALAASYGALIYTHNVSALLFSPFLFLYLAVRLVRVDARGLRAATAALAVLLGLALSAFFWLPALREQSFAQLGPVTEGYFHYANHFRGLDLVQNSPLFNYDAGSAETSPFAMGLLQTALTVVGLAALLLHIFIRGRFPAHVIFLALGLLVSTFMMTPLSRPLWATVPLLPFVQFPWRFLSVQAVFTAAITGSSVQFWRDEDAVSADPHRSAPSPHYSLFVASLFMALLLALAASLNLRLDFIPVADADVTPERLQDYEYFTGNIGTTVNYEYLPVWTQPRPYTSAEYLRGATVPRAITGELASGSRLEKRAAAQTWEFDVRSDTATVAVPLLYWPGWGAELDGEPLQISPVPGMGWIAFELPRGEHVVELRLGATPLRGLTGLVSLATLALLGLGLLPGLFAVLTRAASGLPSARAMLVGSVVLVLLALGLHLVTPRLRTRGPATMDFAQLGWLHRAPVEFENGAVLRGYNYSAETVARGDLLALKTVWQGVATNFVAELVGPGAQLLRLPFVAARAEGESAPEQTSLLQIPRDIAPGVYFLRLQMTDRSAALTPAGLRRGVLYLRPLRVDDPGAPAPAAPLANLLPGLDLANLTARQESSAAVTATPQWRASGPFNARSAIALRLASPDGRELAALDTQAGSGLYPTDLWRPGEVVPDPYPLPLPPGLPVGTYPLTLTLYDAATREPQATVTTPVTLTEWTPRPEADAPQAALTEWLALQAVRVPAGATAGQALAIHPQWVTLASPAVDARARWALTSGEHAASAVVDLAPGLPLTSWPAGVLVAQPAVIDLPADLPSGAYSLSLQLLDTEDNVIAEAGQLGEVALLSPEQAGVTTALPPMDNAAGATFGPITLAGFDAALHAGELSLTLYWQAQSTPGASYKYFVHVFDPATQAITMQWDAFPREGVHPTTEWLPDEVVAEPVAFSLADLRPGVTYDIAVGWYEPSSGARLPAFSPTGQLLPQDRYLLNLALEMPGE